MGVPEEFIFGGLTYTGSNVSMRMLENMFIGYRLDHENMLNNFVIRRIADFMEWPVVNAHMKRFKMADDLQRMGFLFQLNQAQKISDQTLLQECDQDPAVEEERKRRELDKQIDYMRKTQTSQAHIMGETMLIQSGYQAKAQQLMQASMPQMDPSQMAGAGAGAGTDNPMGQAGMPGQQPGMPGQGGGSPTGQQGEMIPGQQVDPSMPQDSTLSAENAQQPPPDGVPLAAQSPMTMGMKGGGFNLLYMARRAYNAIQKADPMQKTQELNRLKMGSPQIYSLVMQMVMKDQGSQTNPLDPMQSPMPQMKPERKSSPVGS
jgi:hypothetical protein